jgi:hypothetical protein
MARLPNVGSAFVLEEKITRYLLDPSNPRSRGKPGFFGSFGFRREAWNELAEALLEHAREGEVVEEDETPFGTQYAVEGQLATPDGRTPLVRAVWLERGEGPRFVTAFPGREGGKRR